MTENKNPGNDLSAEFERQRKRKVLLFAAILGCIFLVVLWLIFRPAPVKPQEGAAGINTTVPDGKAQATVGDKRKAAEQLRSEEQQQKRMMTLGVELGLQGCDLLFQGFDLGIALRRILYAVPPKPTGPCSGRCRVSTPLRSAMPRSKP